jgi:hypothetical protein
MKLVLDARAEMYERDEYVRQQNFQTAVQNGVAKAFGG